MPQPFVPRLQRLHRLHRLSAALLGVHLALSACAAQAPGSELWPQPAQQPVAGSAGTEPAQLPDFAPLQVRPNFRAPSAAHCARPPQLREVPGRGDGQETASHRPLSRPWLVAAPSPAPAVPRSAPATVAGAALADRAEAAPAEPSAAPAQGPRGADVTVQRAPRDRGPVTAGVVDDNADFAEYLAFRARTQVAHRDRDIRERYLLQVRDGRGRPVADAEVLVRSPQGRAAWARTDSAGKLWLHPDAFDAQRARVYEVTARRNGVESRGYLQRGQKSALELRLDGAAPQERARLDLVFLVDATGSMGDEIGKLKTSLRSIADEVAGLPSRPDLCFALVAYRDKGDAFVLRSHDFTNDLGAFQRVLDRLQADGGGDYPEAMNEALHETVHRLAWRGDGATRMVLLLADAPPHLDDGGPQYDEDMQAALGKGIKVFSVGASGLDRQGEYIQRQIAQYTGGRFVFLTYADAQRPASGPGRETVHDVRNYSVQTLDRLIVRLVREELGAL
ncbi:vWA domain-containing protein [Pseudorhodoferax sp.]|uniref:vWA domain-containing protein n=1 Tax=Pseudorhodoferax sp. TaxID=1993553 RepID=UPI002DD65B60|nr:VWA domain-containing protein [Pseudorhodoferax sp.]